MNLSFFLFYATELNNNYLSLCLKIKRNLDTQYYTYNLNCKKQQQASLGGIKYSQTSLIRTLLLASHIDVLRGLSDVPAPRTSAELVVKFLSLCSCSQISVGAHVQIIGEPISAEVKVLKSQAHMYKLGRVVLHDQRVFIWTKF